MEESEVALRVDVIAEVISTETNGGAATRTASHKSFSLTFMVPSRMQFHANDGTVPEEVESLVAEAVEIQQDAIQLAVLDVADRRVLVAWPREDKIYDRELNASNFVADDSDLITLRIGRVEFLPS